MICLNRENKRPTAKALLEKNEWLNDKNVNQNNLVIEIKGSLRQKNLYLNNRYKSGGNIAIQKPNFSSKNVIKYSSKMFNTFNLKSKKSWIIIMVKLKIVVIQMVINLHLFLSKII